MRVAQLDRALGYGPRCREFESSHARKMEIAVSALQIKGDGYFHFNSMPSQADMAELADALDLGSSGSHRAGSSPVIRSCI